MVDDFSVYKTCENCNGTGVVMINDEPYDAGPPEEVQCPRCQGTCCDDWGDIKEEEGE